MESAEIRLLMATDVPFWRGQTGAEQRIWSLVRFFNQSPSEVQTFFLGPVTPEDLVAIQSLSLQVVFFESERPPAQFLSRIKWYADATRRQLQKWMNRRQTDAGSLAESETATVPLTLNDYRWPWAIEQFQRLFTRYRPHVVLAQYITMGYLLEGIPPTARGTTTTVLDTHDILHERGWQFGQAGYLHWLDVDQQQEAAVWNQFDVVLAIQQHEGDLIRSLAPRPQVLVVGHAPAAGPTRSSPPATPPLTLGYLGSANHSNWHALNRFLLEVWPDIVAESPVPVRLLIAGKICEWFELMEPHRLQSLLANQVKLCGTVEHLRDFYDQISIAINPVQFGTGLKIKNVEALAFGRPLVTTASGSESLSPRLQQCCIVAANFQEMSRHLLRLIADPDLRQQLGERAWITAQEELSENSVYAELARFVANSLKTDRQKLPTR